MIVCHNCGFNKLQPDMTYCPKCHQAINSFSTDTMDEDLEFGEPTIQAAAVAHEPVDDEPVFTPISPSLKSIPTPSPIFPPRPQGTPIPAIRHQPSPVMQNQQPHFVAIHTPQDLQIGEITPIKRTTPYHSPNQPQLQQQIFEQQQRLRQQQQSEAFSIPRQRGDVDFDQASVNFIPISAPESFYRPVEEPIYQYQQQDGLSAVEVNVPSKPEPAFKPQHSPAMLDEFRTPEPHYVPKTINKTKPKKSYKTIILGLGILLLLSTTIFFAVQWYQGLKSQTEILLKNCIADAKVQEIPLIQKSIESCEILVQSKQISDKDLKTSVLWLAQALIWFYEAKQFDQVNFESENQAIVLLDHIKNLLDQPIVKENIEGIELDAELLKINLYILKSKFALAEDAINEYRNPQSLKDVPLIKLKLAYAQKMENDQTIELIVQNLSAIQTPQQLYLSYLITQRLSKTELSQHLLAVFQQKYPQHSLYQRLINSRNQSEFANVQSSSNQAKHHIQTSKDHSKNKQPNLPPPIKTPENTEEEKKNLDIDIIANQNSEPKAPEPIKLPSPLDAPKVEQPLSAEQAIKQAGDLLEKGNSKRAEQILNQVYKTNPRNPRVLSLLGWCAMANHQYGLAEARFRSALDYKSNDEDALYGLASAYEKNLRKQNAITTYQTYLQYYGTSPRATGVRRKLENLQ